MKHELLNCLSEAHIVLAEKNSVTFDKIHAAVAGGLFAVVAEGEYRCNSTDAIAGTAYGLRGTFATREEAELKAFAIADQDDEIRVKIYPTAEMEAFRASGLPDDAFSDWKQARNSEAAYERSISDRMLAEPSF